MTPTLSPEALRLLRSGLAALPVRMTFWKDWATGLAMEEAALRGLVADLQKQGVLRGFHGELNPAHPALHEFLVREAGPQLLPRWVSSTFSSVVYPRLEKVNSGTWSSGHWYKVGASPNLSDDYALMGAEYERTPLVKEQEAGHLPELAPLDEQILHALDSAVPFDVNATPWLQIAGAAGDLTDDEARQGVVQLILGRRWRRFSLSVDLQVLGWKGCGLACWTLPPDQAPRAAEAAAHIRGSGDVCVREGTEENPENLTVLLMAKAEGDGQKAAEQIGDKWGIQPTRWIALPDLR